MKWLERSGIRAPKSPGSNETLRKSHPTALRLRQSTLCRTPRGLADRIVRAVMLLEVKNLNIEFHDHDRPERAVCGLNLRMEAGEIVGIVGESGSGKSMSALAIAGLLSRKDITKQGEILFEGKDILNCSRSELRKLQGDDIAMIFQEPETSLNPLKKVGWQVEEALRLHTDLTKEGRRARALEVLRKAELQDAEKVYDSYPHHLSGGMRQRVMIAAAMACRPKLLIADEPTTALDVTIQAQIVKLLKKIREEQHTAVLFISHDLSLIRQLCERVLVMQAGHLIEEGAVEEVFRSPGQEYTKKLIGAIPEIPAACETRGKFER